MIDVEWHMWKEYKLFALLEPEISTRLRTHTRTPDMKEAEIKWMAFFNIQIPLPCCLPYTQTSIRPTRPSIPEKQTVGSLLVMYFMGRETSCWFTTKMDGFTYVTLPGVGCLFNMMDMVGLRAPMPEEIPESVQVPLSLDDLLDFLMTRTSSAPYYKRKRDPLRKSFTTIAKVILTSLNDRSWAERCMELRSSRDKKMVPDHRILELFEIMGWGTPTQQQMESSKSRAIDLWALQHVRAPYSRHDSGGPVRPSKKSSVRLPRRVPTPDPTGPELELFTLDGEHIQWEFWQSFACNDEHQFDLCDETIKIL